MNADRQIRCIFVSGQLLLEAASDADEVRVRIDFALRRAERAGGGARRGPFQEGSLERPYLYGSVRGTSERGFAAALRALGPVVEMSGE